MDGRQDSGGDTDSPLESIAVGAALLVGFGLAAGLLAMGVPWWWLAFPMLGGLVPLAVGLARWYERGAERSADAAPDPQQDALDELRSRYARGELTEAEFERRVERLLETETVADAREAVDRGAEPESATE